MNKLDKDYQDLLKNILENGIKKEDRTGTGTISIFDYKIVHDMSTGFPLLTTKKMYTKGIVTELLWFLSGDTNIKYLVDNGCNIWTGDAYKKYKGYAGKLEEPDYDVHVDDPNQNCTRLMTIEEFTDRIKIDGEFARRFGELGPIYGRQWRNWDSIFDGGIDQMSNLIYDLKNNPDSRRLIVNSWNVSDLDQMTLPPCHWAFELYTEELTLNERREVARNTLVQTEWVDVIKLTHIKNTYDKFNIPERRLNLKWHQRSVDTGLGLPFNIASYGFLLEMLSQQVNMVPGILIGDLTNVHVYLNHVDTLKAQMELDPNKYQLPKLKLNKKENIFDYQLSDFDIIDYNSYSKLNMELSN